MSVLEADWGVELPPRSSEWSLGGVSTALTADELPEVLDAARQGFELAPEAPMWCFLPAFWPAERRTWTPDRSTHYLSRYCQGGPVETRAWAGIDYRTDEGARNELLAELGLPPCPAGRLWLLRPPDRFNDLYSVLRHLSRSAERAKLRVMATPAFVTDVVAVLDDLFS